MNNLESQRNGTREEAGETQTPFEKGNPTETSETQNHRAKGLLPRRSMLAGLPKVRKPTKLSRGVPMHLGFTHPSKSNAMDPLFIQERCGWQVRSHLSYFGGLS